MNVSRWYCAVSVFAACAPQLPSVDGGLVDAGDASVGAADAGADGGLRDGGVHPCASCPAGAMCTPAGVCDYACGACTADDACGPRHRCWKQQCIAHQPECPDLARVVGVRIEVDSCSGFGRPPECQRVVELPFDGGVAVVRREPIAPFDGGVVTFDVRAPEGLLAALLDAGLSCVEQPRLDALSPACITHSGGVRVTTTTTAGVHPSSWWWASATRPPRSVEVSVGEALEFMADVLADAGVR